MLYRAEPHSDKKAAYSVGFDAPQAADMRNFVPVKTGLETLILPAGAAGAEAAARTLAAGGLVAFPTETVYGLGADAANATAIAHLYAAKGRPAFNPLIAHVAGSRGRAADRPVRCARLEPCGGVLAGAADAGGAEDG